MASSLEILNAARLAFLANRPLANLTSTGAVTIPNNAFTTVAFNSFTMDTWNGHSVSVNNTRYTVPVAGPWSLSAAFSFVANATGIRELAFYKNGAEIAGTRVVLPTPSGTTAATVWAPSFTVAAVVGDYFELAAFQNSGAGLANSGPGVLAMYFNLVFEGGV